MPTKSKNQRTQYSMRYCAQLLESPAMNWFLIGILIVISHLFSLFSMPLLFFTSVTITVLLLMNYFFRAGLTSLVAGIPVILGVFYWGIQFGNGEPFNWDVASYELPNYYDFMDHTKGAYSTYALIPGAFFGMAEQFHENGFEYIYGFSILIFSCSLSALISCLNSKRQIVFSAILAILLTTAFQTLFHVGKGDLMAATFTNIALYSFFNYFRIYKTSNEESLTHISINHKIAFSNLVLFSSLTVCSKTGLLLIVGPLIAACLISILFKKSFSEIMNRKFLVTTIFSGLAFYSFIAKFNWWGMSSLMDNSDPNKHILKSAIYRNITPYFVDGYRATFFLPILLLSIFIFSFVCLFMIRSKNYSLIAQLTSWVSFSIAIVFMPYAVLMGPQSIENMRLIAMPLLSLVFIGLL